MAASRSVTGSGFIRNEGQWDPRCRFLLQAPGMTILVEDNAILVHPFVQSEGTSRWLQATRVPLGVNGGGVPPRGQGQIATRFNFLLGDDPGGWRQAVPAFAEVVFPGGTEGADVVLSALGGGVALRDGSDSASLSLRPGPAGNVVLESGEMNASHAVAPSSGLEWATYLGAFSGDTCRALGLHDSGAVTVAGLASWASFPTTPGAFDPTYNGGGNPAPSDVYVSQLDANGETLLWSTFLGGTGNEDSASLIVADDDDVIVVGHTTSGTPTSDFPTTPGVFQPDYSGGREVFVSRLSADGATLEFSTFLGGASTDEAAEVAFDPKGNLVLVGRTGSTDFPTTPGAFQDASAAPAAFVTVLEQDGSGVITSTLLGGSEGAHALGVDVDAAGRILVGGITLSEDFPTTPGAYSQRSAGNRDAFLACLDPSLQSLDFSTYFGGSYWDEIRDVAFERSGTVVVMGMSGFPGIPTTPGAFDTVSSSLEEPFVARFSGDGSRLLMSTFIGGSQLSPPAAMVAESSGAVVVAGKTASPNFPTTPGAYQEDDLSPGSDLFVSRLSPEGDRLFYSTYMGGPGFDSTGVIGKSLAIDEQGAAVVAGGTNDAAFPATPGAFQEHKAPTGSDGFIARLTLLPVGVEAYGVSTPGCDGALTIGVTAMPQAGVPFAITCTDAPANSSSGYLVLAAGALEVPHVVAGANLWVDLSRRHIIVPVSSNALGWCEATLDYPAEVLGAGTAFAAQFLWRDPCVSGRWSASNALTLQVQR